ncbi:hypothetical protein BC834DRAFT_179646 [Gloeopeniophorella convolvens]|nr:hypothetical protein BC834DRAFT_179646 [Gloeopeniophorella convolvens]
MVGPWDQDRLYKLGKTLTFEGEKYQVLKRHVSTGGRTPPATPELYGLLDISAIFQESVGWHYHGIVDATVKIPARPASSRAAHRLTREDTISSATSSTFSWTTVRSVVSNIERVRHSFRRPRARGIQASTEQGGSFAEQPQEEPHLSAPPLINIQAAQEQNNCVDSGSGPDTPMGSHITDYSSVYSEKTVRTVVSYKERINRSHGMI